MYTAESPNPHPHAPSPPPQAEPNFKLNILFASTAFAADVMTGTLDFASMGALFVFSLLVASVLFVAGIIIQRHAGDSWSLATAKSLCVATLLAIPGPIASVATLVWGIGSSLKGPRDPNTIDMKN
jgi:hypothetical protein